MNVQSAEIKVWDPFVRVAHWTVALAFFVAYLTEDDLLSVHVWAGYAIGTLVLLRIVWGLIGPRYARFVDFVYGPRDVAMYLRDLLRLRAPRHLGHSPAGGAMVVALLLCLALTVGTGLVVYAQEKGAGPLAPVFSQVSQGGVSSPSSQATTPLDDEEGGDWESALKEVHELFANITLALVILHILGVALASFAHHENLPRAMLTGRKRVD